MNKIKEAIEQLEDLKIHCEYVQNIDECTDHTLHIEAIDTAVEVMQKKVEPLKHREWVYGEFDIPHCSECGVEPREISPYCPNCGVKVDEED